MKDNHFLLMQQCIRDARQLAKMFQYVNAEEQVGWEGWKEYWQTVREIAVKLFVIRSSDPVDLETMKTLLMASDSVSVEKEECLFLNKEVSEALQNLTATQQKIRETTEEIQKEKQVQTNLRSQNFLLSVIGSENLHELQTVGHIDVEGTNGSTYRIHDSGDIDCFDQRKNWRRQETQNLRWHGKIKSPIINDGIATVYMHIRKNSKKFDIDKGCGSITIEA